MNTTATRRWVSYKWIEICGNSLVTICNFDLENVGLGHWVQLSQLCHSMANIKIYEGRIFFALALTISELKSNAVLVSQWRHSMAKKIISTKVMLHFLRANSHRLRYINIWNIWHLKSRLRSLNTTFAMALIDDKNQQVMLHKLVLSLTVFEILTFEIA